MGRPRIPTRDEDFARLNELADAIDAGALAIQERRLIWDRRLKKGDSTQSELARASRVVRMQVKAGIKPELIARAKAAMRAAEQ